MSEKTKTIIRNECYYCGKRKDEDKLEKTNVLKRGAKENKISK
jgi:hypothetical protein